MAAPPYHLTVDGFPHDHFHVHSFAGKESLSEAYSFDVVATAHAGEDVERAALASRALLTFHTGEAPRAFYCIVSAVRLLEVHHVDHKIKLELHLVPRLFLLKKKQRTRIFQKMRVPDIVTSVLGEAGIVARFQLTRAYPEREYVTQYEESDYRFVLRLLAEAGIYFYFFGGEPVDDAALTADAAIGAAASVGGSVLGEVAGSNVGALVGSAAEMAETLIPGDSIVCADDAACYPPVAGDDPAALAASTAAALAPAVADALGAGDGIAGAVVGTASAVAGSVIASATEGGREAPVMRFLQNEQAKVATSDKIIRFVLENSVRSSAAVFRDYDPARPRVRLQSSAVSTQPFPPSPFEAAAMAVAAAENAASSVEALAPLPGAVTSAIDTVESVVDKAEGVANQVGAAFGQKVPLEVYEHHSPFLFPQWGFANEEAPRILRQKRRRASIATGEGGCSDFSPGHRFALHDHPAPQLDGEYALTTVVHRGETHPGAGSGHWRVYWNEFECVPAGMSYPPKRPKRKSVQVLLTATVVGPPGEEIFVDPLGQIKVQFHWDREGKHDARSSCWIRAMQPWSGAGWGHQFIPRVGMEVVVAFEGGDPDKPLVLGSVPNGTHPPPFLLPGDKTRSGIRTQTSPGGGGYNELSFEDRRGAEVVYLHAQRDHTEVVRHDQSTSVGRHVTQEVGGARTVTIHMSDSATVRGDRSLAVGGHYGVSVRGNHHVAAGDKDTASTLDLFAWGDASLGSQKNVLVNADAGITLQCGTSSIQITPKEVAIHAQSVVISGDEVKASGKGPSLTLGDDAEILGKSVGIFSSKASVELGDDARIDGQAIKLNCKGNPPSDNDENGGPAVLKPLSLKLTDEEFVPYAGKEYTLVAGGRKYEGTTDGEGKMQEQIPAFAESARLVLWIKDKPVGERMVYLITVGDIPDVSTVRGAWMRLQNLGYHWSGEPEELDETMREALMSFQEEHGLPQTGENDDATQAKLVEVHGS